MKTTKKTVIIVFALLFAVPTAYVSGNPTAKPISACSIVDDMSDIVYDENGEVIEFSMSIPNDPKLIEELEKEVKRRNITLSDPNMNEKGIVPLYTRARSVGSIFTFVSGACFLQEFVTGMSCPQAARAIGLELVNGWWMMGKKRYSGKWQVTYGYAPGCLPMHSPSCYRSTFSKIG